MDLCLTVSVNVICLARNSLFLLTKPKTKKSFNNNGLNYSNSVENDCSSTMQILQQLRAQVSPPPII